MLAFMILDPTVVILENTAGRINISIKNDAGALVDPFNLKVTVFNVYGGNFLFTDEWVPTPPPTPTRLVRTGVGQFYLDFGNLTPNNETHCAQEWLFNWSVSLASGGSIQQQVQKIKVISLLMASYLPELRLLIDKSRKLTTPDSSCFLGYTDGNLITYLEGGIQTINAYQPSLTFSFQTFPLIYKQILIEAALVVGVMSQELFAIDTDIPNYNDQGTSFVITHQAQLASFLNQLTQRLDKLIPQMKLQLLSPGSLHIQMGPNYRLSQVVEASPSGSLFRNMFFRA